MLFVSWQWKPTVYVLFLASCLGQELFRECEQDYCFERSTRRQQSSRRSNQRNQSGERYNRILENRELRLSDEAPRDARIKREAADDVIIRFDYRADEGHNVRDQYQVLKRLNERFDIIQEQQSETHFDKRDYENGLNNDRERIYNDLERFEERTDDRNSDTDFERTRARSELEEGRRLARPLYTEARKPLAVNRDGVQRNERLQRRYSDGGEKIERHSIEYNNMNRRSQHRDELFVRKTREFEQQERDINSNSHYINRNQIEINRERHDDGDRVRQNSENRGRTERIETVVFRGRFDDRTSRRANSHRQSNFLLVRDFGNQKAINSRRSVNDPQSRRVALLEANPQNSEEAYERINVPERSSIINRYLVESRDRKPISELEPRTQQTKERRETFRSDAPVSKFDVRRTTDREMQHELPEDRTNPVTQEREKLIENSRLYENQEAREENSQRLEDEREKHFRQTNNHENEETRAGHYRDIAQQAETRSFNEREVRRRSQDTQRLRLGNSERNNRRVERPVSRTVSYEEKHERRSARRIERFEERNEERRVNDRLPDKQLLERNIEYFYHRNSEDDNIKKPTGLLFNGYTALGQGLLFAYVLMKTCNGEKDFKNHPQTRLREALRIVGF